MTKREKKLAVRALSLSKAYNDTNPEVGIGPFIETLANDLLKPCGYKKAEIEEIVLLYKKIRQRSSR